jgi:excisionase family DNA binding protein
MKTTNRDQSPSLMTPAELAIHLGVSKRTVQRLTVTGQIPVVRIGTLVRYDADKVIAALADSGCNHA